MSVQSVHSTSSRSQQPVAAFEEKGEGESSQSGEPLVHAITPQGDYFSMGGHVYRRKDLANIVAGDLDSEVYKTRPSGTSGVQLANPVPLGLASFSFSCLTLSLVNARVRGVTEPKLLAAAFLFFGGAIELFAGLLCFVIGDTYSMTVFSSFGGFWICWGCLNIDQFHVATAYADDAVMKQNVQGFFLAGWVVFTFLVMVCSMKSTWGLFLLLFFLDLTFLHLCIGSFINNVHVMMAGGYFGILSSCCGWYSLYCAIADPNYTYVPMRAYPMPHSKV
ncbi:ATO3 (YDR384C) [Zygosaccharomyces parabailii]|uniref:ZYBA0S05-05336g1_1 n=1 Tax=Zygosaccharomyces bailii (strain CLIB 213 / ATCC 58445 / CBS 680 / BCRC 21525 / NBRC 1098 / NCYC 1416 / NRRL Y-2227) TaxID=1333698 RepID=A0A8J2T6T8_ZYGB2|nr:ATO3 (YDR384C) [Zygosaccharomyces parabailii]CDF89944.1 ZYBA0S05-05336g1_1 [Zygosaccharomyces bailii CLIB 213]SJM84378.1 related to Ammonia transport outward protein 3 [Zygosaccharomyces bailii]